MKKTQIGTSDVFVPAIGQGTWKMGTDPGQFDQEVQALQAGIEAGMTLIDTAEMYADGGAERVVGKAIEGVRDKVFLVTKVWPSNGSYRGVLDAASRSLKRLGTDYIDLYLLHWPSATYPVSETMRAMKDLLKDGVIRFAGVSNFDVDLLKEAQDALGKDMLACNQVGYHLKNRVIEKSVLPYCQVQGISVMAYSPFGAGDFPASGTAERQLLDDLADKYGVSAHAVVLSWLIAHERVIAIPKSSNINHVRSNAKALTLTLSDEDVRLIDERFPLPAGDFQVHRY